MKTQEFESLGSNLMTINPLFMKAFLLPLGLICFTVIGCSSVPPKPDQYRQFQKSPIIVEQATLDALAVHGFVITKHDSELLQGYRPRVYGSATCNPGGETASIWVEGNSSMTKLWILTEKSSFGLWCQKDWTPGLLKEINSILVEKN